ncbi:fumble-domain-containing protein [Xylariales sp. PMI_506]|nr:fumble-domain-containing protein [Xylariales sp. PMI_506]
MPDEQADGSATAPAPAAASEIRATAPSAHDGQGQPQQNEQQGGASDIRLTSSVRRRTVTSTAEIDSTIIHPGSVRINVKGAFIVDTPEPGTPAAAGPGGSPVGSSYHDTKDIRLPNHTAVVSHIAVDIGGSLAKIVYFTREAHSTEPGGRLNFLSYETDRIDDCIEFMKHLKDKQLTLNGSQPGELCVMATGGGAYKFYDRIRERLGVDVLREDEMECLIIGLDFFITEIPREVFTYSETDPMHFAEPQDNIYPYMLVNIGSGVSILKVSGPRTYERVGGTSLGGGTLWGILSLLTPAESFDEMLDMAAKGDNAKVDMLVGDIYGTDYGKIGLKSTTIASSFGKVFKMKREAENEAEDSGALANGDDHFKHHGQDPGPAGAADAAASRFSAADVSRSLLYAISNNIGQIAYLQSQIHNLSHIYFGGSFIRGHPQTMNTLSYAIKFWSKGQKQAYFLRHEGYLGAVGAFLKRQPRNWGRRGSFEEGLRMMRVGARVGEGESGSEKEPSGVAKVEDAVVS